MTAQIISIETRAQFDEAVQRAAEMLRAGELVALPTETVYGLAANAWNADAVGKIYEAKGRPPQNPIIVHVSGIAMAQRCAGGWPETAKKLASAFWPGPLTMVLPRSDEIPPLVTAGGPTVGLRWPNHPFMQAVIEACGFPLAAPSANRSNQISPTSAEHVRKSLGGRIPLIIDGGSSAVGIESTVVDLASEPPRLLRPGMISANSLRAIIGASIAESSSAAVEILRSPGQWPRHYAPKARLVVLKWHDDSELASRASLFGLAREKIHILAYDRVPLREKFGRVAVIPADVEAYGRALYAELHCCDESGAELIIVEAPPTGERWSGIADRLRRAAQSET